MAKTILIVDDSTSIRQLVSMALKANGYNVVEAVDGKDGLSKLDSQKFDLVVSDVNMPNMNGLEMVKNIKANPQHKFTSIMMLTTESQESLKQEGKALGVRAWLVKPFNKEDLLFAVSKLA
ncbi:MAG: response regulator [Gammaproteobacteria bacterium]|nr:response regulator [Gammaproteobacteria bacterium]